MSSCSPNQALLILYALYLFFDHINSRHSNIRFTTEKETRHKLPLSCFDRCQLTIACRPKKEYAISRATCRCQLEYGRHLAGRLCLRRRRRTYEYGKPLLNIFSSVEAKILARAIIVHIAH